MAVFPSLFLICVIGAGAAWAGSPAGVTASITGTLAPVPTGAMVRAVCRDDGRTVQGKVDPATGRFEVPVPDSTQRWDIIIAAGGCSIEGFDFSVPRSDYEEEQPLSTNDIAELRAQVKLLNRFEDTVQVLAITGNIQHAAALLNKLRTKPFYNSAPGEVVWRAELWRFEKPEETWVKRQDELFTIYHRERFSIDTYRQLRLLFDPALGGLGAGANAGAIVWPQPWPAGVIWRGAMGR